jgi:hypothetical protein
MTHTHQSGYHAASKGEGGLLRWEAIMSDMFTVFVNDQLTCSSSAELQKSTKTLYLRAILDEELLL